MSPARPPRQSPDSAAWRLAFHLTAVAFDAGREKFVRLLILLIIIVAAAGGLVILLGPYVTAGLGIGTFAGRTYTRRTRR